MFVKCKAVVHYTHFSGSLRKVSEIYGVSKSSLQRWVKQETLHRRKRRTKKEIKQEVGVCIERCIESNPFLTMNALSEMVAKECKITKSRRTINRYATDVDLTMKKATRVIDYKHDNGGVKGFCENYARADQQGNLICIDEAGFYLGDHRRRGWAKKGKRLKVLGDKSLRRSKLTLILAISANGIVHHEILDHNCKKPDFVAFIGRMNAPRGSVLLMDNLRLHHSKETKAVAERKNFNLFYIPAYSPKCNAIENVFGAMKPDYRLRCPPGFNQGFDYRAAFARSARRTACGCAARKHLTRGEPKVSRRSSRSRDA